MRMRAFHLDHVWSGRAGAHPSAVRSVTGAAERRPERRGRRPLRRAGFECRAGAYRVARPLVPREQGDRHGLELPDALVGPDRLADREDADGRVPLLDHVPQHVEVRVVGHARLADPPYGGPDRRLRAVDRLALSEVELVARAAAGGAPLADELDPLGVVRALADVDDQADRAAV